jgi:hypothetical protein
MKIGQWVEHFLMDREKSCKTPITVVSLWVKDINYDSIIVEMKFQTFLTSLLDGYVRTT